MGILNFYKNIEKYYSNIYYNLDMYDNIHFDISYYLYLFSSFSDENEDILISNIINKCFNNIIQYKIIKSAYFYIDNGYILAKSHIRKKRSDNSKKYNKLDDFIKIFKTKEFKLKLKNKLFELSKTLEGIMVKSEIYFDDIGEAEIKIKKKISDMPEDSHLVIGSDADYILLLSSLDNRENIFMIFKNNIINIDKLLNEHISKFGGSKYSNYDFILLNLLQGNDYFPKIKYITFEKSWNSYKDNLYKYPDGLYDENNKINYKFLKDILNSVIINTKFSFINTLKYTELIYDDNDNIYENYINGLKWCFDLYKNCKLENYIFKYETSIHPLGFFLYLSS